MNPVRHQIFLERLTMDTTAAGIARHHDEIRILFVHQLPYAGHPDIDEGGRLDGSQKRLDLKSVQVKPRIPPSSAHCRR